MKLSLSYLLAAVVCIWLISWPAWSAEDADLIGRFEIVRFDVQGNTLLPAQVAEQILAPFIGMNRDFSHVQRALEALESAYHQRGFNLVQVNLPEQELNQGVVHFQVIETRIGKVRIEGNKVFDEANIRNSVPGLREGEIPRLGNVSHSLKLANDNPAKKTSLQLQGGEADDEVNAVLKVTDDKVWRMGLNLDNTGNESTGKTHVGFLFQHANVMGRDHVASLQYTTTLEKPSQISVYGAGYHIPLYAWGDSIDLFTSYSDVDSGMVSVGIVDLQVSGRGSVWGARYTHNLPRVGNLDSRLVYGADYKAYRNNVTLQGVQLGNDVTVRPFSIAYTGTWALAAGETDFNLTAMRNLPGAERGGRADFERVRAGASPHYSLLRYGASYNRAMPADWLMRFSVSGQYTRDALVPGEQFGAGGAGSVRGFQERDVANDSGYLTTLELMTPNWCTRFRSGTAQCRALVFYDAARVSRCRPLPGEATHASIGSIGAGLRFSIDKYVNLQMDYGHVVDAGITQSKGDNRLHFRLALSY